MRNASKNAGELIDTPHARDEPRPPGRDHPGDPGGRGRRADALDRVARQALTFSSPGSLSPVTGPLARYALTRQWPLPNAPSSSPPAQALPRRSPPSRTASSASRRCGTRAWLLGGRLDPLPPRQVRDRRRRLRRPARPGRVHRRADRRPLPRPRAERPVRRRLDPKTVLPVGPLSEVSTPALPGRGRPLHAHLLRPRRGRPARPRRVPAPALRHADLARGRRRRDAARR